MRKRSEAGFTLIEMMVVIVIIGILATVVIMNFAGKTDQAALSATKATLEQLSSALEFFKMDNNKYPDKLEDLLDMPSYADSKKWPPGGYLKKMPVDGWGKPFVYRPSGSQGRPFDLGSLGKDGLEGGEGYDADIWQYDKKR